MVGLNAYESEWAGICDGMEKHPNIKINSLTIGEVDKGFTAAASWRALVGSQETAPPAGLEECHLRFRELACVWGEVDSAVSGEFHLTHIAEAVPPDDGMWINLWGEDGTSEDDEEMDMSEMRIIDVDARTGTGCYAMLRLAPGAGEPEIWYSTVHYYDWKMDIGYREYLDMLRMTKGAFKWQLLFTDAPLGTAEFDSVRERLERMLESLPILFPEYDYEPLRKRLATRSRCR